MTRLRSIATAAIVSLACAPANAADPGHPVVAELFQSQGCSSCPPANANLNAIAGHADVLALSFGVTYWDRLGWKDTFAHPRFAERQWDYAKAGGRGNVSTPQMIVNGRGVLIGHSRPQVAAFIRKYDRGSSGPVIATSGSRIAIAGAKAAKPATVWLVRYDLRIRNVPIRAGENGGRTLPHRNIVRSLVGLGQWTGACTSFAVPASPDPAWHSAVIVQQGRGGTIIAARRI
ncbi:MAG: DUF1223 domain-containing protein [Sphingomonas bacterium]|nr:DUF1223 domain-containing protein [Sphingomonas bacterium]